jgi:hypothetical protein
MLGRGKQGAVCGWPDPTPAPSSRRVERRAPLASPWGATRNALLGAISAKFAAELPAINEATGRLKSDLQQLKDSVEIIRAVASTLGIIENVVKLLA